ncbi:MAG: AsmA family protein [Kiritimatiellae bacterium]|nr:AsmA family protein [Kiritimatiellia bacterium]
MSEKKKCGCFCKLLKFCLWCCVAVLVAVVLVVATIPLWISPVSTGVANSVVPKITGTKFHIERFYVNPWTGAVRIKNVKLSNPEGYGEAPAFSLTSLTLDLAITELFSNKLHVKELLIEEPFASYYSHDGVNNIDAILANVDKALGLKEEKEEEKPEEKEKPQMKVIIDHIRISGTKVKLMENDVIPPVPIMTIERKDIGKESGGASFDEVWTALSDAFMKGMGSVGDGLGALGGLIGDGAKSLGGALSEGTKSLGGALSEGTKSVTGALGGAASATGDGASAAAGATADAAKNAAGVTADAAKSVASGATDVAKGAADAVSDGTKAAVDAVGDTAQKATEGVKNLFKGFGK